MPDEKKKFLKWKIVAIAIGSVGLLSLGLWMLLPDDDLIQKSVFVINLPRSLDFQYINDETILVVKHQQESKTSYSRLFSILNLKSGIETNCPLEKVTFVSSNKSSFSISPDKKSVLSIENVYRKIAPLSTGNQVYDSTKVSIDSLDGKKHSQFETDTEQDYVWSTDSLRISGISRKNKKYQFYDFNGNIIRSNILRDDYEQTMEAAYLYPSSHFSQDTIKVIRYPGWSAELNAHGWCIFDEKIGERVLQTSRDPIHFPLMYGEAFGEFSPDGKRIAWALVQTRSPGDILFEISNVTPSIHHFKTGLWTSDDRGGNWKRIGAIQGVTKQIYTPMEPYEICFHWLPDGKNIAYKWLGKLYTVKAD